MAKSLAVNRQLLLSNFISAIMHKEHNLQHQHVG